MNGLLRGVALAAGLSVGAFVSPAAAEDAALALANRLDARHRSVSDLTAKFVQSYRSGMLGREVVERGVVSIKRPGRMLWEYRDPEKKTFVSDGHTFYFYVPKDKQVIVREQAGARGLPTLLLSGQGDIVSQFEVAFEEGPPGLRRLRLTPRAPDPEIETVRLDVDARERIVSIEVVDVQGSRSRFHFENIRENVGLPDGLFRFEIPRGVEVVAG